MKLFRTMRIGTGRKREATAVVTDRFQENGTRLKVYNTIQQKYVQCTSILTIFSGTGGGKSEAEKLCEMLNFAYQCFHEGKDLTDGKESTYVPNITNIGTKIPLESLRQFNDRMDNDRYHG